MKTESLLSLKANRKNAGFTLAVVAVMASHFGMAPSAQADPSAVPSKDKARSTLQKALNERDEARAEAQANAESAEDRKKLLDALAQQHADQLIVIELQKTQRDNSNEELKIAKAPKPLPTTQRISLLNAVVSLPGTAFGLYSLSVAGINKIKAVRVAKAVAEQAAQTLKTAAAEVRTTAVYQDAAAGAKALVKGAGEGVEVVAQGAKFAAENPEAAAAVAGKETVVIVEGEVGAIFGLVQSSVFKNPYIHHGDDGASIYTPPAKPNLLEPQPGPDFETRQATANRAS